MPSKKPNRLGLGLIFFKVGGEAFEILCLNFFVRVALQRVEQRDAAAAAQIRGETRWVAANGGIQFQRVVLPFRAQIKTSAVIDAMCEHKTARDAPTCFRAFCVNQTFLFGENHCGLAEWHAELNRVCVGFDARAENAPLCDNFKIQLHHFLRQRVVEREIRFELRARNEDPIVCVQFVLRVKTIIVFYVERHGRDFNIAYGVSQIAICYNSRVRSEQLSILIPAFNEAETIGDVIPQVRQLYPEAEILVVDDGSTDDTARIAESASARVVRHPYNKGNGASVKTGLRHATRDIVTIFDADGQHDAADIEKIVSEIGVYDLVVGARDENSQTDFGRRMYHHVLNALATYLGGMHVPDATSGFRAARRADLMQFIHLLPNGFSTPVTTSLAFIKAGYSVKFISTTMQKRQGGVSKIKPVRDGTRFIIIAFRMSTMFAPMKLFLPVSVALFVIALVYTVIDILFITQRLYITNSAVLLFTMTILIFLIGLVAEQIAALRFERVEKKD